MSKDERKEQIENIAEKFMGMDDGDKKYIIGYMNGINEERKKWLDKEKEEAAVATV